MSMPPIGAQFALVQQHHIGPIPPAEQFKKYPPEAQRIILEMAREEQKRRNDRLDSGQQAEIVDMRSEWEQKGRVQHYGLLIALAGLTSATFLGFNGDQVAAAVIGGSKQTDLPME
ncbi:hypothetical protein HFQ13_02265 [Acidithiobacillus sp. VAN18-1]|uniref:Uncharacterized protein n=1 Tax=Igneacidithiobacillus copahuensis TaxID=2724909 RepID=A0AAE2YMX6_9PROT|nr:hypothetical protein [Igneacidithiobacillus copahuensis]